jgi:hypothetical protein
LVELRRGLLFAGDADAAVVCCLIRRQIDSRFASRCRAASVEIAIIA